MMKATKNNRADGAKGALLDEYERALYDLKMVVTDVSSQELVAIVDAKTEDPDCKSIQTVLTHVVRSAFGYATYIRTHHGVEIDFRLGKTCDTVAEYAAELDAAFAFTEETFLKHPHIQLESLEPEQKIRVRWGQLYDFEQLMEHAIVHVLRHRRQIERFLLMIRRQD